jgi:hypothetical protein
MKTETNLTEVAKAIKTIKKYLLDIESRKSDEKLYCHMTVTGDTVEFTTDNLPWSKYGTHDWQQGIDSDENLFVKQIEHNLKND